MIQLSYFSRPGPFDAADDYPKITSVANPVVKHTVRLRETASYREEHDSAVLSSMLVLREVSADPASFGVAFKAFYVDDAFDPDVRPPGASHPPRPPAHWPIGVPSSHDLTGAPSNRPSIAEGPRLDAHARPV